ncbi:MAG: DEAD/DEAH box helicase [Acidimicrobiia bacterium]|nr:DEAD/DEAH box helicase [Acidimicrobiia bacterium]
MSLLVVDELGGGGPAERAVNGGFDPEGEVLVPWLELLGQLKAEPSLSNDRSALVEAATSVLLRPGFETFVSLPRLRFEPFPHQLQAAARVLRGLRGRAILADEVGLGKTIEAGLVASELRLRGVARRILVLAPAGLVTQWRDELERKFALPTVVASSRDPLPTDASDGSGRSGEAPIVVASIPAARRAPLRDRITADPWDLVIVDEAHRVKNPASASGRLVRSLRAHHLLLLTATPVENRLDDLFQLVSLVRPGLLGTPKDFRSRHGGRSDSGEAVPTPRNVDALRTTLREAMVRHRRSEVEVMLPPRLARTLCIAPGPEEASLYHAVSERVRREARGAAPSRILALGTIQRLAGSSPAALAPSLERLGWEDLSRQAGELSTSVGTAKSVALADLLARHHERGEKVIVFTGFRASLVHLASVAGEAGVPAAVYHGSLTRRAKEQAIDDFRGEVPVLVTTEAAGEGRNLQFCHTMINFDLPWNPMQIEQRLGRIHRIGQQHDVLLENLVASGTIEERILRVLETKINVFELVVGELDMILGRVEESFDFQAAVFAAHVESSDDDELDQRLDSIGDQVAQARLDYISSRSRLDALVGDDQ